MNPNPTIAPFSIRPPCRAAVQSAFHNPKCACTRAQTQPSSRFSAVTASRMVVNFQFASGQLFSASYLRGQSGLVYLLTYPVLFFGRAGTALGVDGLIARGIRKAKPWTEA